MLMHCYVLSNKIYVSASRRGLITFFNALDVFLGLSYLYESLVLSLTNEATKLLVIRATKVPFY